MSLVVLDTNVVSYLMKGDRLGGAYQQLLRGHDLVISFMTVAEMYEGAYRAGWGEPKLLRLERVLRAQPISVDDAWIAASALAWSATLATHNADDFASIPMLTLLTAA